MQTPTLFLVLDNFNAHEQRYIQMQSTLLPAAISAVRHPATQETVKHLDVRRRERRGRRGSASAGRRVRSGFARAAQAGISPKSVIGCQHRYSN